MPCSKEFSCSTCGLENSEVHKQVKGYSMAQRLVSRNLTQETGKKFRVPKASSQFSEPHRPLQGL
jgi:hypothetical protein